MVHEIKECVEIRRELRGVDEKDSSILTPKINVACLFYLHGQMAWRWINLDETLLSRLINQTRKSKIEPNPIRSRHQAWV